MVSNLNDGGRSSEATPAEQSTAYGRCLGRGFHGTVLRSRRTRAVVGTVWAPIIGVVLLFASDTVRGTERGAPTSPQTAGQDEATLALVVVATPSVSDIADALPSSLAAISLNTSFFVELWAQTSNTDGLAQVSADISFDPDLLSALAISHSSLFSLFPSGSIDNENGHLDNISGSYPPAVPPCSDQVGLTPDWARVVAIEMQAHTNGIAVVQSSPANDGVHFVAICGSPTEPTVNYGAASLAAGIIAVPALSEWGVVIMALLLGTSGTLVLGNAFRTRNGAQLFR